VRAGLFDYQRNTLPELSRRLITAIAITGFATSLTAQSVTVANTQWSEESQRGAEDAVARKLESMRATAKLPELRRVPASVVEVQLVCTAARTGTKVFDPRFGGLETYVTDDLSVETEPLKVVALGTSQSADGGPPYQVYSKDWPRYSVVVQLDRSSKPDHPIYMIGIARRPSLLAELFAPITYDNPIEDSRDWKKQVDPACRKLQP
jgi:hypothetical protein